MSTITINVTEKHIRNGGIRRCKSCPIALAFGEIVTSETQVIIGFPSAVLELPSGLSCFDLPQVAVDFIGHFDRTGQGNPFSFELPRKHFLPGMLKEQTTPTT